MPYQLFTTTKNGKKVWATRNKNTGQVIHYSSPEKRATGIRMREMFSHLPKQRSGVKHARPEEHWRTSVKGKRFQVNPGIKKRTATYKRGGHKIKIGIKHPSLLTEEDVKKELHKLPESEIKKINRVNMADYEDYKHKINQKVIPKETPGFVHPKRPKDIFLVSPKDVDYKDVLQHESGHSMTDKEYKHLVRHQKEFIDSLKELSDEEKQIELGKFKEKVSDRLANRKKWEIYHT